jgi:hypothetical protein
MRLSKKLTQNVAQSAFLSKLLWTFTMEKVSPKFGPLKQLTKKTTHSSQSPNRRKLAQSGHPVRTRKTWVTAIFVRHTNEKKCSTICFSLTWICRFKKAEKANKQNRSQSYNRELQRQRCKNSKLRVALCVLKTDKKYFHQIWENALAYYSAGVICRCK